ncbi:hypothetical protein G4Y79_09275 [Phototrophicus methaneseepsis]|uniref:Uncharacterized protein n=1 Tax=Phototrophicus methaneseepsis TaxID=2710758 RepID=A0A7S8ECN9_9CHLR|nr:hypothetical protein [Phototrophicus methaneseepsis]QPC84547.1 hypothetical protein G4Y79_09275 [Phototrophicus methaneseepsis]
MFDDIEKVPWERYAGMPDAPKYIRNLISEDPKKRDIAYDQLISNYVYENLLFSHHLITYMIRIIEQENTIADVALILQFLIYMHQVAPGWMGKYPPDPAMPSIILEQIESSLSIYERYLDSTDDETKEVAQELVQEIKDSL